MLRLALNKIASCIFFSLSFYSIAYPHPALRVTFSRREEGDYALLLFELLAEDLQPEPLVLGPGQRNA